MPPARLHSLLDGEGAGPVCASHGATTVDTGWTSTRCGRSPLRRRGVRDWLRRLRRAPPIQQNALRVAALPPRSSKRVHDHPARSPAGPPSLAAGSAPARDARHSTTSRGLAPLAVPTTRERLRAKHTVPADRWVYLYTPSATQLTLRELVWAVVGVGAFHPTYDYC